MAKPQTETPDQTTPMPDDRQDGLLDTLFGVTPEVDDTPEPVKEDTKPDTKPNPAPEPEADDDAEIDYDAPDSKKPEAADDDAPVDESAARKQAKEKGREAKRLAAELAEKELERERIFNEKVELEKRLAEIEAVKVNPNEHPDFVAKKNEVLSDVNVASRRLRGEAKLLLPKHFGEFMQSYYDVVDAEGDDVLAADDKLTALIFDRLKLSEVPFDELTEAEKGDHQQTVDRVLDVLERNYSKTRELSALHGKLTDRAKAGKMTVSVRDYENTVSEFKPVLEAVGNLSDDIIDANPHTIEAVVAKQAKESPEFAKRLTAAKKDVLEFVTGPKALTMAEIEQLEANGTDVKSFMVERSKAHRDKQKKLMAMFVQALATRAMFPTIHKEWSELKGSKDAEDSEFDALRNTSKGKPAPSSAKEEKKTLSKVLGKLFNEDPEEYED